MSTRSAIIAKIGNKYYGVYCHSDGYLSWNGKMLLNHYNTPELAAQLIALGDLSSLNVKLAPSGPHSFDKREEGVTVAYGRDRGETGTEPKVGSSWRAVSRKIANNGHVYVFEDGQWCVACTETDDRLMPLTPQLLG